MPKEYIPAVNAGIQEALESGVVAGYPMVDLRATLVDGSTHDVDSRRWRSRSPARGRQGGRPQGQAGAARAHHAVEVVTPEDFMGDVIGDLSSRRGKVGGMEQRGDVQVVTSQVPLAEMFGYATDLRSWTQGRAPYSMQFDCYQAVPDSIAAEIVARVRGQ